MLVAFEGIDGSGKRTQLGLLDRALQLRGVVCKTYTFPDYDRSILGRTIREMLMGRLGDASAIHPCVAAPLFALERSEKKTAILQDLRAENAVLCDRYVYSNVAHQACRLPEAERSAFTAWIEELEFQLLQMPRPDITILLDIDDNAGRDRRNLRAAATDSPRQLDEYERDTQSLSAARQIYQDLAARLGWAVVPSSEEGRTLSSDEIHERVLRCVLSALDGDCNHGSTAWPTQD